jgi:hypothetical protein
MEPKRSRLGAYFLCNDVKIDWAYTFLTSFREYNPTMPLTLIPFDHRIDEVSRLQSKFSFEIQDLALVEKYSELTVPISGAPDRLMHKLAAFSGAYDYFFYLDTDILLTSDLAPLAQKSIEDAVDFVYFDTDVTYCYGPGPFREEMIARYHSKAFNSGCWFSRRGLFDWEQMNKLTMQAQPFKEAFFQRDQSLLNYYCEVSGVKMELFSDLMPEYHRENFCGNIHPKEVDGRWVEGQGKKEGYPICLIHFAGQVLPSPSMPCYRVYLNYRVKFQGMWKTQIWNVGAHFREWARSLRATAKNRLKPLLSA